MEEWISEYNQAMIEYGEPPLLSPDDARRKLAQHNDERIKYGLAAVGRLPIPEADDFVEEWIQEYNRAMRDHGSPSVSPSELRQKLETHNSIRKKHGLQVVHRLTILPATWRGGDKATIVSKKPRLSPAKKSQRRSEEVGSIHSPKVCTQNVVNPVENSPIPSQSSFKNGTGTLGTGEVCPDHSSNDFMKSLSNPVDFYPQPLSKELPEVTSNEQQSIQNKFDLHGALKESPNASVVTPQQRDILAHNANNPASLSNSADQQNDK